MMGDRGYTLIEVMMAIAVMTVGAVGVMGLQSVTTKGNSFARQMTVATEITESWLERLQRDALLWNTSGAATATTHLRTVPRAWFSPTPSDLRESWARTFIGQETRAVRDMHFCTNVQLGWVQTNDTMRAEVRTWWHRRTSATEAIESHARLWDNCGRGMEVRVTNEINAATSRLHVVQASTLIRWSPL